MTRTHGAAALLLACVLSACGVSGSNGSDGAPGSPTSVSASATRPAPTLAPSSASRQTSRPASPTTAPDACAGNARGRLVVVRVKAQHLWMCQGHRTVRDTAVTTGIPGENTHTPKGRYRVQVPSRNTSLTLLSGDTYAVKYWIPFDAPLFGFHDSSWQKFPYGSPKWRTEGSHGCVHMPLAAIRFLYRWAKVGTRVHIT